MNTLLHTSNESTVITIPEQNYLPEYDLDWTFIDKDSIRVTFDLFSLPKSLINAGKYDSSNQEKINLRATMVAAPSQAIESIQTLQYFLFVIRPYNSNKEIKLKLDKLQSKGSNKTNTFHFSNALKLTALNHHEKYTVCICYYQKNISTETPDLVLCQDVINDYSKFADLKANVKHGLLFIVTQYSIIVALLAILQSTYTLRKRRVTETIRQHVATTAHTIRTTLSSVSLVRHSVSSFETGEHHANNGNGAQREPTIPEEEGTSKRKMSSPAIVISEADISNNNGATSSDETEPFLRHVPSKNHVHFLLGPGEGSDDEFDHEPSDEHCHSIDFTTKSSTNTEPYRDQSDALLSMAHILDTNKPWLRHSHDPSVV